MKVLIIENKKVKYRLISKSAVSTALRVLGFNKNEIENEVSSLKEDQEYFIRL